MFNTRTPKTPIRYWEARGSSILGTRQDYVADAVVAEVALCVRAKAFDIDEPYGGLEDVKMFVLLNLSAWFEGKR